MCAVQVQVTLKHTLRSGIPTEGAPHAAAAAAVAVPLLLLLLLLLQPASSKSKYKGAGHILPTQPTPLAPPVTIRHSVSAEVQIAPTCSA
jgi:hypothetical protein